MTIRRLLKDDKLAGQQEVERLSRIAQLDQRTALPDQCLHSAEADVRPPRRKSGFRNGQYSRRLAQYRDQTSSQFEIRWLLGPTVLLWRYASFGTPRPGCK